MRAPLLLGLALLASGCASTPSTTAVLLPGDDGKAGAIVVNPGPSETVVKAPYQAVTVRGAGKPAELRTVTREEVERDYGATLAAEPPGPARFTLYFVSGTSELTEVSRAQLPLVLEAYWARSPAKVLVIGHTDRAGSEETNLNLSLVRAHEVEQILRATGKELGTIEVKGFGESDPVVPTADNVPEPRNRRVEVLIL